jgi:hypothetical protein
MTLLTDGLTFPKPHQKADYGDLKKLFKSRTLSKTGVNMTKSLKTDMWSRNMITPATEHTESVPHKLYQMYVVACLSLPNM